MTYDLLFKSLECLSSKLSWQIEEIKRLKKKLIRNDIGCTGKIKTSLTFVFLSFLTQWPTLLFFSFYSFFCLHKHYRWTKQIDKCGKFMKNKDSNSKDKAKQTWQMTSQKRKIRFLGKNSQPKTFMLHIPYHWFKRDIQHLEFEWRMNTFFIHRNEARNWPSPLVKSKIARKRNPNRFLEGFMKIRELLVSDFTSQSLICDCDCDFNKELGQVTLLNKNQLR